MTVPDRGRTPRPFVLGATALALSLGLPVSPGGAEARDVVARPSRVAPSAPAGPTPVPFPIGAAVRVGDPAVSYLNVEFSDDGKWMVWFEGLFDGAGDGVVWHCAVDPDTGELDPPDGRGFRAFESTIWLRGNPGADAAGVYYVGSDRAGRLHLVRPTGPTTGAVELLATPADVTRRAIYASVVPGLDRRFVFWIKNERAPGGGTNPANAWFELQWIDVDRPREIRAVERQARPSRGFCPMDFGFLRWVRGAPAITYGSLDAVGRVQSRRIDVSRPEDGTPFVTTDAGNKVDPFGWARNGTERLLAGIDGLAKLHLYARPEGSAAFSLVETFVPPASRLEQAALAQSAEPVALGSRLYAAYQVNDAGSDFYETTFSSPGEIWLTTIGETPQRQWLLASSRVDALAEPETVAGPRAGWVFFNSTPIGSNPYTGKFSLWKAPLPRR